MAAFSPPARSSGNAAARDELSPKSRRLPRGSSPTSAARISSPVRSTSGAAAALLSPVRPPPPLGPPGAALAAVVGSGVASVRCQPPQRGGAARSPSPQRSGSGVMSGALADLNHSSIVALSQTCTEELEARLREKGALTKLVADLKKKKMQYDAKLAKKRREVDGIVVQTLEMDKKSQALAHSNKTVGAEVTGLRSENERVGAEVEELRRNLREAQEAFESEVAEVERLRQTLYSYRKEVLLEAKQRDSIQQDLRATRTAQSLMINRLDDMEKRNRALKSCVADTFNL